jgi:conjugal transfer ATP-binding protein TraC
MNRTLADYLEIWGTDENVMVFADGSLGMAFKLTPIDVSCASTESVNELSDKIMTCLNSLPVGLDVQFVQDIESGNEALIKEHEDLGNVEPGTLVSHLRDSRAKRLRDLDSEGRLPKHSLKIFIRRPMTSKLLEKPKIFGKPKNFEEVSTGRLRLEVQNFERVGDDLSSSLRSLGLAVERLPNHDVVDLIYDQWNPHREEPLKSYDPDDIRPSLLFTDVGIYERGFSLADVHHRILSLKVLPDRTFASMAASLRSLPFGSRLFLTFNVPDQQKELEKLQTQRRIAFSMVSGKRSGVSDIESQAKLEDLEGLIEEMVAAGEKVFRVSLNVLLKSDDPEQLNEMVSQSLQVIRELGGADAMEETLASFDVFSQVSLPNARCKERTKYLKTSNLADFIPIFGPWAGHATPRVLLRSRMGSLLKFDPFSPDLTNANQIISGGSGSGKSFLTNVVLMQTMKENPQVFIVDIGGSYKKMTQNFSGQYIPLGVESGLSLNPFDLGPDDKEPSPQKVKFLLGLVELMTKENEALSLGKLERAEIESAIAEVYRSSPKPSLSVLRELLLKHPDPHIGRFGRILASWCGNTPYGNFVDQPTSIELERSVVCFDLKGMDSYPDLQAVVLFIITDFVWREVQRDRARMKFLVFDECWKLLENESGAAFIGEVFRTFRKYRASAIAISQNIDDFAKSKVAAAILSNSSIKWILKQKGADQERLKTVLALNDNEVALIASLTQERGVFSEAFLMVEDNRSVVAVDSTPLEYWIATTDPRDLAVLDSRVKADPGLSNIDVLMRLATDFPRGCAA